MLICSRCGREEFGNATHCRQCGALLPFKTVLDLPTFGAPSESLCLNCGAKLPALAARCAVCGQPASGGPEEIPTEVGRIDRGAVRNEVAAGETGTETSTRGGGEFDETLGRAERGGVSPFAEPAPGPEPRSATAQIRAVFTSLQPQSPAAGPAPAVAPASVPAGVKLARSLADEFVDDESEAETAPERTARERAMAVVAAEVVGGQETGPLPVTTLVLEPTVPVPEEVVAALRARRNSAPAVPPAVAPAEAKALPPQFAPLDSEPPLAAPHPAPDSPEQRLACASRAVERSIDRSSPHLAAIKAGAVHVEPPRPAPAVRAALEPALAQGRQRGAVGHDDATAVYPALNKQSLSPDAVAVGVPTGRTDSRDEVRLIDDGPSLCSACGATVAGGNRFCGECGRPIAPHRQTRAIPQQRRRDDEDNTAGAACRARLVLVRGGGAVGAVWSLGGDVNRVGRVHGNVVFGNDPFLSPWHATFFYRDTRLLVRDDNSRNGVFLRLRRPEQLQERDRICIGRQLFVLLSRASWAPVVVSAGDETDTRWLASPRGMEAIYLARVFASGDTEVYLRHQRTLTLGRNGCDVNFPDDDFLSQRHCRILRSGEYTVVEDLGSRNGTFLAIRGERALENGDELMIGNQVLRVDIL
ncbi:MAG: FHA domain-containing protein [Deltaproteobacteria bacterium]|nr:FHA domain-containing protein [Deltaproteobacteria bacterium]